MAFWTNPWPWHTLQKDHFMTRVFLPHFHNFFKTSFTLVALGLGLFCIISLLIGIAVVGFRKKTAIAKWVFSFFCKRQSAAKNPTPNPLCSWFIGSRVQLRALWRDDGDRIHLEMADAQQRGSIASASMTSFENPTFKHLLAQEEEKATMAAVYEQKVPSLSYDDKTSITFANPLFESGAKA